MHWSKFADLTIEFFLRDGYQVELGQASNYDGSMLGCGTRMKLVIHRFA
jgi:hypothetical protein